MFVVVPYKYVSVGGASGIEPSGIKPEPSSIERASPRAVQAMPRDGKCPYKRAPTARFEVEGLRAGLEALIVKNGAQKALALGVYSHIPRSHAVSGRGLLQIAALIMCVLSACSRGAMKYLELKAIFESLLAQYPAMSTVPLMGGKFEAGFMAERIMTIMNHVRRLKDSEVRWRQAARQLCEAERAALKDLVGMLEDNPERATSCEATTATATGSDGRATATTASLKAEATRALHACPSDVSLDNQGFPSMLKAEEPERREPLLPRKRPAACLPGLWEDDSADERAFEAATSTAGHVPTNKQQVKKAAVAAKELAKAAPATPGPTPKSGRATSPVLPHATFGEVKLQRAQTKTYILYRCEGKWVHLLSVYAVMGGRAVNHRALGERLFKAIATKSLNAGQAVAARARMLASQ